MRPFEQTDLLALERKTEGEVVGALEGLSVGEEKKPAEGWNYEPAREYMLTGTCECVRDAEPVQGDGLGRGVVELDPIIEISTLIGQRIMVAGHEFVDEERDFGKRRVKALRVWTGVLAGVARVLLFVEKAGIPLCMRARTAFDVGTAGRTSYQQKKRENAQVASIPGKRASVIPLSLDERFVNRRKWRSSSELHAARCSRTGWTKASGSGACPTCRSPTPHELTVHFEDPEAREFIDPEDQRYLPFDAIKTRIDPSRTISFALLHFPEVFPGTAALHAIGAGGWSQGWES